VELHPLVLILVTPHVLQGDWLPGREVENPDRTALGVAEEADEGVELWPGEAVQAAGQPGGQSGSQRGAAGATEERHELADEERVLAGGDACRWKFGQPR
jgi:hypothetical protein